MLTGYNHPNYAASLHEFGKPRLLPHSGGWVLEREIPGAGAIDAMGPYPLFCCRDWSALAADLKQPPADWVSLALVSDPFGGYSEADLQRIFPDRMIRFKEHYIADLSMSPESYVSNHHRRYVRKALDYVRVWSAENPPKYLQEWQQLYTYLIQRHQITGIQAFSTTSFRQQLSLPGAMLFMASEQDQIIAAHIWFVQQPYAYYHLGASNERGYELWAAFALFWHALETLAGRGVRWANLGAGAGLNANANDGLSRFKRGWATDTRPTYFCGRIFDPDRYQALTQQREVSTSAYFPAYRAGEFS